MPRRELPSLGCASSSDCETECTAEVGTDIIEELLISEAESSANGKGAGGDADHNIETMLSVDDNGVCIDFDGGWSCINANDVADCSEEIISTGNRKSVAGTSLRGIHSYPQKRIARLRRLKRSMTISSKLEGNVMSSHRDQQSTIKKAISLDERSRPRQSKASLEGKRDRSIQNAFPWGLSCECNDVNKAVADDDTFVRMGSLIEDEPAYDSDPEEFYSWRGTNINPTMSEGNLSSVEEVDVEQVKTSALRPALRVRTREKQTIPISPFPKKSGEFRFNIPTKDDLDSRLLKEIVHGDLSLVWHDSNHGTPTAVKAWIELGCRLKKKIIQPKLMWRSTIHEVRDAPSSARNGMAIATPERTGSIDLLDIARVLKTKEIDREYFPFAIKDRCFAVITLEHKPYLFEAANTAERDRTVSGLKLLVARLASMIIVGDDNLFLDFFHPMAPPQQRRLLKKILN